jgi:tetratricopeptide (TPR) repeat protein
MSSDGQDRPPGTEQPTHSDAGIPAGAPSDTALPHTQLGDFELLREIGRGGMGVVYEARQISLKRHVALKVLPPGLGLTDQAVQRFEREAQAAGKLHHTNIVPVHATGEDRGCHYYAMELVQGQSLAQVLNDLRGEQPNLGLSDTDTGGREWFDTVARLMADVGDALHYAHGQGVIHRDVKPANLLLSDDGRLCLGDFGLARVAQEPGMTVSGSFLGTPAYMSPEQVAAGRAQLDHRTDVYSLGAVLYEMLTLQRPFQGDSREQILTGILSKDPRPPRRVNPRVPVDLETICLKAMEKDPDRRYATAGEMAADLRQFLQRGLIAARRAGPLRRFGKRIRGHPIAATVVAATILVLILAGFAWQVSGERNREAAARATAHAQLHMNAGEYQEALGRIDEALGIDPRLTPARLLRARILMQLGRTREAVEIAQGLLASEPDDWTAHLILAAAAESRTDPRTTIAAGEHVRAVERLAPETAEAYYLRALMLDSSAEAVALLDRALEIDPGNVDALVERIQRRIWLKNFGAALVDCEQLVALRPRSAIGRNLAGTVHLAQHNPQQALVEAERAIRLDPEDPKNYDLRASVFDYMGRFDEAIADLTRRIELNPDRAESYAHRAKLYSDNRQLDLAEADARRAIEVDPECADGYQRLGFIHMRRTDDEGMREVVDAAEQALSGVADPRRQKVWHAGIARFALTIGEVEWAAAHVERSLELDRSQWLGHIVQARILLFQGEADRFHEACERAAAAEVADPGDFWDRGRNLRDYCRRSDLVLADFSRAIELAPWWADPYKDRGETYRSLGRLEEGLTDLNRAIELAPHWGEAHYSRGRIQAQWGRFEESLADYERAEEMGLLGWLDEELLRFNQAEALDSLGRAEEGLELLDRMVARNPQSALGRDFRARFLFRMGRVEEALAELETIETSGQLSRFVRTLFMTFQPGSCDRVGEELDGMLQENPRDFDLWNGLAWIHAAHLAHACPELYDPERALDLARRSIVGSADSTQNRDTLGLALYRNGLYEEAREVLQELLEVRPSGLDSTLLTMAMISWKLGHEQEARTYYDRAVAEIESRHPTDPEALRRRDEVARLLGIEPWRHGQAGSGFSKSRVSPVDEEP